MLVKRDLAVIRHGGISITHDYWFNSLIAGEPYLEEDLLTYFDGRVVTIYGFPVSNASAFNAKVCRNLADKWVRQRGAEGVVFVGPRPVGLKVLTKLGFHLVAEEKPNKPSAEMLIDCTNGPVHEPITERR